ncbi:hypothetical protein [Halonotius roseus]|uniref:HK97 gp10 family phage protein n=1 Tax=Halonotius roseus TaxID=2511997 RepID=A0A544QQY4_9EURY|nr:hypothetical protein [Halonotius roseus]TQQ81854.1 hypothetical protein EWF95_02650 [Halonotius roseus]
MRFSVDVDSKAVAEQIEDRIEAGISDAQDEIARGIEDTAQRHIRTEGAVFRYQLIEGFETATLNFGSKNVLSVRNVAPHAPAQERGVSGTETKRDTPYSYTDTKPPVEDLVPWVKAHLVGTGFAPD